MSAYALIIGLLHVSGKPVVISDPDVPFEEQRKRFKKVMSENVHPDFQRIEFVDSRRGVRKRKKFISPAEAKTREKTIAREKRELAKAAREKEAEAKNESEPPPSDPPPSDPPPSDPPPSDPPTE